MPTENLKWPLQEFRVYKTNAFENTFKNNYSI